MSGAIVYEGVRRSGDSKPVGTNSNKLFAGYKLWFSRTVPQRAWLIQNAFNNGAVILPLEKDADVRLVDHARKEQTTGTHSYRWVEASIRNGRLEDLADHAVGLASRANRPVGSTYTAPRTGSRVPYTPEEDQWLWNVMMPFIQRGGMWKGNEIYKQIESMRPQHTYQSWRDHWIKVTCYQKRNITEDVRLSQETKSATTPHEPRPSTRPRPVTPPQLITITDNEVVQVQTPVQRTTAKRFRQEDNLEHVTPQVLTLAESPVSRRSSVDSDTSSALIRTPSIKRSPGAPARSPVVFSDENLGNFTMEEARMVYRGTKNILETQPQFRNKCWSQFAAANQQHTTREWREFWELVALPKFCERRGKSVPAVLYEAFPPENKEASSSHLKTKQGSGEQVQNTQAEPSSDSQACSRCFATDSKKWRQDKAGKPLCNNCRMHLKQSSDWESLTALTKVTAGLDTAPNPARVRGETGQTQAIVSKQQKASSSTMTPNRIDVGVQISPLHSSAETVPTAGKQLVFPQSPIQNRQPEPNEARKRSSGKSSQANSQDSKASENKTTGDGITREMAVPEFPPPVPCPRGRKRKLTLQDDPQILEIPSTPENVNTHEHDLRPVSLMEEDARHQPSPTRQTQSSGGRRPRYQSPLFVPMDEGEEEAEDGPELTASTPRYPDLPTMQSYMSSPPKVNFFDDQEDTGSDHDADDDESDTGSTRSVYQFETAPEGSRAGSGNWETAPETPIVVESESEDRTETQALFDQSYPTNADQFALPDPTKIVDVINLTSTIDANDDDEDQAEREDDGWEFIRTPQPSHGLHDSIPASKPESQNINDQDPETQSSNETTTTDFDTWVTTQTKCYPNTPDIDLILQAAIEATSFNFSLAGEIVQSMVRTQAKGKQKEVLANDDDEHPQRQRQQEQGGVAVAQYLPRNVRGCWTAEDDNLLFSQDARDVLAVERKHGAGNCNARFEFLEAMANS